VPSAETRPLPSYPPPHRFSLLPISARLTLKLRKALLNRAGLFTLGLQPQPSLLNAVRCALNVAFRPRPDALSLFEKIASRQELRRGADGDGPKTRSRPGPEGNTRRVLLRKKHRISHLLDHRIFYLCKRILDPQVTEFATVLEVFAEKNRAAGLLGRSDNEGVVPRESTMAVEAQCLGIESGRGVYR
jgi:hypothetical protein